MILGSFLTDGTAPVAVNTGLPNAKKLRTTYKPLQQLRKEYHYNSSQQPGSISRSSNSFHLGEKEELSLPEIPQRPGSYQELTHQEVNSTKRDISLSSLAFKRMEEDPEKIFAELIAIDRSVSESTQRLRQTLSSTFDSAKQPRSSSVPPRLGSKDQQSQRNVKAPFSVSTKGERGYPTGAEVLEAKRRNREEEHIRELISKDPTILRTQSKLQRLEEIQRKTQQLSLLLEENNEAGKGSKLGSQGQRTTQNIISEWRKQAATVKNDHMLQEKVQEDRAQRAAERALRDQQRIAESVAGGTSLAKAIKSQEAERASLEDFKKKWRVPKGSFVEVFCKPKLSCFPLKVVEGEEVFLEMDSTTVNGVHWVLTNVGWVPAQITVDGIVKMNMFAETRQQKTNSVREFMLDETDASAVKISEGLEHCGLHNMKTSEEVRAYLLDAEVERQKIRELPSGHHDFIHQAWRTMQENARHYSMAVRETEATAMEKDVPTFGSQEEEGSDED